MTHDTCTKCGNPIEIVYRIASKSNVGVLATVIMTAHKCKKCGNLAVSVDKGNFIMKK